MISRNQWKWSDWAMDAFLNSVYGNRRDILAKIIWGYAKHLHKHVNAQWELSMRGPREKRWVQREEEARRALVDLICENRKCKLCEPYREKCASANSELERRIKVARDSLNNEG